MPDLSRQLLNTAGANQDKVNDYTDDTDWPTTELSESGTIEPAVSRWSLRVPNGDIPDHRAGSLKYAASHNVVKVTVGSNTLFRGRNAAKDIERGDSITFRNQRQSINLADYNQDLAGIIVNNWTRAEETDSARVQGLVAAYLSGSPRLSTNLNGSNFVVTSSNTVTVAAKTYTGVSPGEILRELAEDADKDVFVDRNGNLHYHGHDYSGFDSILRISDDPADLNTVTCQPIEPVTAHQEGADSVNRLRLYWGPGNDDGNQRSVVANATGLRDRTDYWEDIAYDDVSRNETQAERRVSAMLAPIAQDVLTYTVTIGLPNTTQAGQGKPMTGDYIWMVKAGQRIQFKSKAVRGGYRSGGTNFGDEFETMHIRNITWTMPTADAYFATLDLEKPRRIGPRRRGRPQPTATNPRPAPEFEPSGSDTLERFYNANDPGGDSPSWSSLLSNQGGSGDGANGTDWYMFHSNSPNAYETTWAWTAGDQMRVTGYLGCRTETGAGLIIAFTDQPPGTSGANVPANILSSHVLATNPVKHSHSNEWTLFSAGPFTAPEGTTSVALGKYVSSINFDEISMYKVADAAANDDHAVDYGDCDHDSPFFLPSDYIECRLDEIETSIAGITTSGASAVIKELTNKSGGQVIAGDLVIVDSTTDESFTTTSTANAETSIGVAQETIEADAVGNVALSGYVELVTTAGVSWTRGQYAYHSSNTKTIKGSNTRVAGAMGQFLKSGTTPSLLLWGVGDQTATGSGGSGGTTTGIGWIDSTGNPDRVPASPSAQNDEFEAGSLDAKWTQTGSSTLTFADSKLIGTIPSASEVSFLQSYSPGASTAFTITAKFGGFTFFENIDYCGIIAADSGSTTIAACDIRQSSGLKFNKDNPGGAASVGIISIDAAAFYIRMSRDTSNVYTFEWSNDGVVWSTYGLATGTSSTTVAKVGFRFGGTAAKTFKKGAIDWFRRT